MLSETFQADMPLQMFVFPVLPNTPLDPAFTQFLSVPAKPVSLDPRQIAEKREQWLKDWTEAVLR
jgi:thiamine transport system substrate-binding protein